MRQYKKLVATFIIFVVFVGLSSPTMQAQSVKPIGVQQSEPLPDFVASASVCLEYWDGITARVRFSYQVRNIGNKEGAPNIYLFIGIDHVGGWISYLWWRVGSLKPNQTWSKTFVRIGWDRYAVAATKVNDPPLVPESNTSNNYSSTGYVYVDWCPGYGVSTATGYIFIDKNGNGRKDPNEIGIKNAIVQLWQGSTLKGRTIASWPSGSFSLKPPAPGTYTLTAIVPSSSVGGRVLWTTPRAYYGITLSGGGTRGPFYFGVRPAPPSPPKAYYSSPTLRIETTPRYPVVVGQDPTERGADISVVVTSPPALFEWYEWDDAQGKYVKRQEKVPVPVIPGSVELYGSMTAASQDWVRLDLASRYPGARLQKVEWDMNRDVGLRVVENRTLADGTTILRATAFRVPFADPGTYTLRASAKVRSVTHATTGLTVPQRTVSGSGTVHVYVKDSTLR